MIQILLSLKRFVNFIKFYTGLLLKKGNRNVYKKYKEIKRNSKKSDQERINVLLQNVNKNLTYANKHVIYYHKIFKELGLVDDQNEKIELNNLSDLEKLPVLNKNKLHKCFDDLTSDEIDSLTTKLNSSGGSTGKKAMFLQDTSYRKVQKAIGLFYKYELGIKPWHNIHLLLWGSQDDIGTPTVPTNLFSHFISNDGVLLNSSCLTQGQIESTIEILTKVRFDYIRGYAQSLYLIAKFINNNAIQIKKQKIVISTATSLSDKMRYEIKQAFRCSVIDFYGSREVGSISYENLFENEKQLFTDQNLMEIVDKNNFNVHKGRQGKILLTTLNNKAMPLIRYDIGDMASSLEQQNYLRYNNTEGRTASYFKKRNGDIVDGTFLTTILNKIEPIDKFQIIQHNFEDIEFKIVSHRKLFDAETDAIEKEMTKIFGDKCTYKWSYLTNIEPTESGKYLYIISKV